MQFWYLRQKMGSVTPRREHSWVGGTDAKTDESTEDRPLGLFLLMLVIHTSIEYKYYQNDSHLFFVLISHDIAT